MRPRKLDHVLSETGGKLSRLVTRARAEAAFSQRVTACLPTDLAPHVVAANQKEGELVIVTDSSAWAARLRHLDPSLEARLASAGLTPQRIRIRVRPPTDPANT